MSAADDLADLLTSRSWTIAVAESCTGGLVGHLITSSPGSSAYFQGGIVAYSHTAKMELLGVTTECLRKHGSVSERTAVAMANGARDAFQVDLGVGLTGIAGPGGGTDEKPVGTVCIAVAGDVDERSWTLNIKGSRDDVRQKAAEEGLKLVCKFLQEQ